MAAQSRIRLLRMVATPTVASGSPQSTRSMRRSRRIKRRIVITATLSVLSLVLMRTSVRTIWTLSN